MTGPSDVRKVLISALLAVALWPLAGFNDCGRPFGYMLRYDQPAPKGLAVRINKKLARALSLSIERTGILDFETLVPVGLETDDFEVDKPTTADGSRLDIRPTDDGLLIRYVVFNAFVQGSTNPPGPEDNCNIDITIPRMIVDVDLSVRAKNNGKLDADIEDVDVDFEQFDADIEDCDTNDLAGVIGQDVKEGTIRDRVRDAIEEKIESDTVKQVLADLGEFDASGALSQVSPFTVQTFLRGVNKDDVGFRMKVDLGVAASNPVHVKSWAITQESVPNYGKNTPNSDVSFGLGAGLSTSAINQALMAATDEGLLMQSIELRDSNGESPHSLVPAVLDGLGVDPGDGVVTLNFLPTEPPVMNAGLGPGNTLMDVQIDNALIGVGSAAGGQLFHVEVSAELGISPGFDDVTGGLTFEVVPGDVEVVLLNNWSSATDQQVVLVVEQFILLALPEFVSALQPLQFPDLSFEITDGKFIAAGLDGIEFSKDGHFLSAYIDPVIHLCVDNNGDLKTDTNLVEVTCYRDMDNDGWPASNGKTRVIRCNKNWCPAGWTRFSPDAVGRDCNDMDNRVHPDMEVYFQWETLDGGYDFNCDGKKTKNPEQTQYEANLACGESGYVEVPTGLPVGPPTRTTRITQECR